MSSGVGTPGRLGRKPLTRCDAATPAPIRPDRGRRGLHGACVGQRSVPAGLSGDAKDVGLRGHREHHQRTVSIGCGSPGVTWSGPLPGTSWLAGPWMRPLGLPKARRGARSRRMGSSGRPCPPVVRCRRPQPPMGERRSSGQCQRWLGTRWVTSFNRPSAESGRQCPSRGAAPVSIRRRTPVRRSWGRHIDIDPPAGVVMVAPAPAALGLPLEAGVRCGMSTGAQGRGDARAVVIWSGTRPGTGADWCSGSG